MNSTVENVDLILKLEILEIYNGSKYTDVVISEINFDGLYVHCLAKGTKVYISDGKTKNIEDIAVGDSILSYNTDLNSFVSDVVEKVEKAYHCDLVKYVFSKETEIITTKDHPFMLQKKGWASFSPEGSKHYIDFENISKIEVGDGFYFIDHEGNLKTKLLIEIIHLSARNETYTISKMMRSNNFIANGFIVGIEALSSKPISATIFK